MSASTLALDFGTSNSAAAMFAGNAPRRLAIEGDEPTLPTAVFFPTGAGTMRIGAAAAEALIAGDEGRYMRALKSVLGTSLFHESRRIGGRRQTLSDVVAAFIAEVKRRAEAAAQTRFDRVLCGRPVHFHSQDPERDRQAETDLRACCQAAGFEAVRFLPEPEAAALACRGLGRAGETGLIVDIGGGTSDFSLFRIEGQSVRILASHGIRLGGTDFDQAVSMTHVMPLLGLGGDLRASMGGEILPAPRALYADLATWAKIPFLYAREVEREVEALQRQAVDPSGFARLSRVIHERLGHELAFASERGKIAANNGDASARIEMGFVEPGLSAPISPESLAAALADQGPALSEAMSETLRQAEVAPEAVESVVLVGGSSLMRLVQDAAGALFPQARTVRSDVFGAVADGLALAASEPWRD